MNAYAKDPRSELELAAAAQTAETALRGDGYIAINPHLIAPTALARTTPPTLRKLLLPVADRFGLKIELHADGTVLAFPPETTAPERRRARRAATAASN